MLNNQIRLKIIDNKWSTFRTENQSETQKAMLKK